MLSGSIENVALVKSVIDTRTTKNASFVYQKMRFFERCVPHTRNVMCPSDVMSTSCVMFAFGKRIGTHHITDCVAIYITTAKAVTSFARVAQTSLYNRASARFFFLWQNAVYPLRALCTNKERPKGLTA